MQTVGRVFAFTLLIYLSLDFADPNMPGALNFDPDQCVEAVQGRALRAGLPAPSAADLPPIAMPILELEDTLGYPSVNPAVHAPRRLPRVTRARAVVSDCAAAAADDH